MRLERAGAAALIIGSLAGLVVMGLHPQGIPESGPGAHLNLVVHAVAAGAAPVLAFGFFAIAWSLGLNRPVPVLAFLVYAFGAVAVMLAAAMSGLVAPYLVEARAGATGSEKEMIHQLLHFEYALNQAFAKLYVGFGSAAILLFALAWSGQGLLGAAIRLLGVIVGVGLLAWFGSGTLKLNVHGMGAVVAAHGLWTFLAALGLLARPISTN